jgi:hypothetical protein
MIGEPETLKLSDKTTVTVGVLDGYEQDLADGILCSLIDVGPEDQVPMLALVILTNKVYGVGSVRAIDGVGVEPLRGKRAYAVVASRFTREERGVLSDWATTNYSDPVSTAEIKKESSDRASDP